MNKTTFNISWEPLPRVKSYGKVTSYEVKTIFLKKGNLRKRSVINSHSVNTSATFVVLSDFELCSKYDVSVRAYTTAGPGPYGKPLELETSSEFNEIIIKIILACDMIDEKKSVKITDLVMRSIDLDGTEELELMLHYLVDHVSGHFFQELKWFSILWSAPFSILAENLLQGILTR